MYAFLSHDWAGLVIALSITLAGTAVFFFGRRTSGVSRLLSPMGASASVVGMVLCVTSAVQWANVERMWDSHPAPGVLVDVGGYRMHILAEGENRGKPTVVFIPGGHSSGYSFFNLHKIFRDETRSVLFDRPATGWSDIGPFPRSSYREAEELNSLMRISGEREPLILVGHSYGGLLALVYAMRFPDRTAGIVLLDPGLAELYRNPLAANFLNQVAGETFRQALMVSFGIPYSTKSTMLTSLKPV